MLNQIKRRDILAAAAIAALPMAATAKSDQTSGSKSKSADTFDKPYDVISPPVAVDAKRVRLLFTYDCPYCRSYHNGLVQWGATIPTPLRFDAVPVLTSQSNNLIMALYGRLIMQNLAPSKVGLYDYAMYTHIQGDSDTGVMPKAQLSPEDVMRTLMQSSGASGKQLQDFVKKHGSAIEKQIPLHASMINTYGLKATPAVAIGGRILVNPDHAGATPQQYLLLLNAMVSRAIQGGLDAL